MTLFYDDFATVLTLFPLIYNVDKKLKISSMVLEYGGINYFAVRSLMHRSPVNRRHYTRLRTIVLSEMDFPLFPCSKHCFS